jgi:hypothetical protein
MLAVLAVAAAGAWLGQELAAAGLGAGMGFLDEVLAGSLLFAGALALSLAEPLEVGRDARAGLLTLRVARGGSYGLGRRWLGLLLATLPAVALAALAAGGLPPEPWVLLRQLGVLCAAGLALGAWCDRHLLVPVLWVLLVAGHLRPWLLDVAPPLAWALPRLGEVETGANAAHAWAPWLHAGAWSLGAVWLARWRLAALVGRGGP